MHRDPTAGQAIRNVMVGEQVRSGITRKAAAVYQARQSARREQMVAGLGYHKSERLTADEVYRLLGGDGNFHTR